MRPSRLLALLLSAAVPAETRNQKHTTHASLSVALVAHACMQPASCAARFTTLPPTPHRYADHDKLKLAADCTPREYPKPDGKITFDINTSLYRCVSVPSKAQPASTACG